MAKQFLIAPSATKWAFFRNFSEGQDRIQMDFPI